MNSHDGAVCGPVGMGDAKAGDVADKFCVIEGNCEASDEVGISGDDARVVPDQNEGTSECGDTTLGVGSQSLMEMEGGTLPVPGGGYAARSRLLSV